MKQEQKVMEIEFSQALAARKRARGFTLIEMMVAMAIFIIVASAAFSLFNQHQTVAIQQQTLSTVNIGLRNAMAQLQMDISGGGQNLLLGLPSVNGIPVTPFGLGAIIQNNVAGTAPACAANTSSWAYPTSGSACFDSLAIVGTKPCTLAGGTAAPVLAISDVSDNLNSSGTIHLTDPNSGSASNDASCFTSGDEILVIQYNTVSATPLCASGTTSSYCITVTTLSANATSSGSTVTLTANTVTSAGLPSATTDPLGVVYRSATITNFANELQSAFTTGAYVVDLGTGTGDTWYSVMANPSNSTDAQLVRCPGGPCTTTNAQLLADQVIGFKVGAGLWGADYNSSAANVGSYFYDSTKYCNGGLVDCTVSPPASYDPGDFALIRSLRISMIARTQPKTTQAFAGFQNGFDGGPYLVQQASVIIDMRNMTINEFGN